MTSTAELPIVEALALIDEGLGSLAAREVMSASEVADMLLDLRMLLAAAVEPTPVVEPAPVG